MKTTQLKIDQLEKELTILKEKLKSENTSSLIKIPELNIEVTKTQDWSKPYNEIVCPKGFRKIKIWELWFILDGSKYMDKVLGDYKGRYNLFWCEQTSYAKKNNYSSRLCLGGDLGLSDCSYNYLGDSVEYGRVVFCRDLKEIN